MTTVVNTRVSNATKVRRERIVRKSRHYFMARTTATGRSNRPLVYNQPDATVKRQYLVISGDTHAVLTLMYTCYMEVPEDSENAIMAALDAALLEVDNKVRCSKHSSDGADHDTYGGPLPDSIVKTSMRYFEESMTWAERNTR